MTLKDFLKLIQDKEARIEVEINDETLDYHYRYFWLSDYRSGFDVIKDYRYWTVDHISFLTMDNESQITIGIRI